MSGKQRAFLIAAALLLCYAAWLAWGVAGACAAGEVVCAWAALALA